MTEMHNPPHPGVSWDMDLRLSKALGTTRDAAISAAPRR